MGQAQLKLGLDFTSIQFFKYTNFPFYSILIRLELAIVSYSYLQLVVASGYLVNSQTPSLIILVEQTNFPFYTTLIQLEIAELAKASYS